jgi:hypothetical protein
MKKRLALAAVLALGLTAAAPFAITSFLQAPAGVGLPFRTVDLPPVKIAGSRPAPATLIGGTFGPSYIEVLSGNLVITSDAEMKAVWDAVLTGPYDPTLFDFANTFVVWMGGNSMQLGSFGINAIERVDAEYSNPMGFGGPFNDVDPFIAATSLTFFPGAFPQNPPPPTYRVSAAKVDRDQLDDVVFHRSFVFAP